MFDLELVCTKQDGEPYRYVERVESYDIATRTAGVLVRRVSGEDMVIEHVLDGPTSDQARFIYLLPTSTSSACPSGPVIGFANITEVIGE